jgi:hypothetical protein
MRKADLESKWKKDWKFFATGSNSKHHWRWFAVCVPDKLNDETWKI